MNGLITECLKRKQLSFLTKVPDTLLNKTEQKWLAWIKDYTLRFGVPPTLTRFQDEFIASFVIVESENPLRDIFELEITEKKNAHVRAYIQAHQEELRNGADPTGMLEKLNQDIFVDMSDSTDTSEFDKDEYLLPVGKFFTGISVLDDATGGINDGDLVYVVGRPQDGKTTLLLHLIARWYWEGKTVLVISNEIPWKDMLFKIDSILAGIPVGERRSGKFQPESKEKLKYLQYLQKQVPNKIIVPKHPVRTSIEVQNLMRLYKPDIVCIDGAYLMSNDTSPEAIGDWKVLAAVSRDLKQIANTLEVPIVGVIQANRGASEGDKVAGHNIAGTDAFFQDPDIVISVRQFESTTTGLGKSVKASTTKNRHGVMVSTTIVYDFEKMTMKEQV